MDGELDAQLAELEANAPLTEDVIDTASPDNVPDAEPAVGDKPDAADKPQKKYLSPEEYEKRQEDLNKAIRLEREQRRAEAQRAQALAEEQQRMELAFQAYQAQVQARLAQQPPPDPYQDPEAARQWQAQQLQQQQVMQQQALARQQQAFLAQQEEQRTLQVVRGVEEYEAEFRAKVPDYDAAVDHLLNVQEELMLANGYPKAQVAQVMDGWSRSIAAQALATGRDPAQVAYDMAKRMGYAPSGAGANAAAEKLDQIRNGKQAAQTLSGGGSAPQGSMSLKQLGSLRGAAFDAACDKFLNAMKG